jgi:hypothetical protein
MEYLRFRIADYAKGAYGAGSRWCEVPGLSGRLKGGRAGDAGPSWFSLCKKHLTVLRRQVPWMCQRDSGPPMSVLRGPSWPEEVATARELEPCSADESDN